MGSESLAMDESDLALCSVSCFWSSFVGKENKDNIWRVYNRRKFKNKG